MIRLIVGKVVGKVLDLVGLDLVETWLSHRREMANNETERRKIDAGLEKAKDANRHDTANREGDRRLENLKHQRAFKLFWTAWAIATLPLTFWFAWGVIDSMLWNGAILPDVAELPPQIKEYADDVWGNLFYAGAGLGVAQIFAGRRRGP